MKLHKEILRLAVPSILAGITVPLVGMVDIAVAGHLSAEASASLIGGISIGTMLFDLLYWNFTFLRAGTGGLTAQAYGSGQPAGGILGRALRIALLSGLALIVLQWVVVQAAFLVVRCSPQVQQLATRYFYIRIWAAPATLSLFAFKGWFIGLQDSVRPMVADLLVNGLNMLVSPALSFGWAGLPAMGFDGVAVGTVVAQWSGFAYCLAAARRRYAWNANVLQSRRYVFQPRKNPPGQNAQSAQNQEIARHAFFRLNRDLFLRSIGMIAVYIGFTVLSARYGDLMLAVSSILMKFLLFFSYFTDGFAYAGEALTGRFIGEHSLEGVRSTVRQTFAWSWAMAGAFMLVYGLGGTPLLRLMTSAPEVVEAGKQFLPWLLLMPFIGCPAFLWDGIFIGATASRDLRNSTLLCAVGFFAVWLCGTALGADSTPAQAVHLLMAAYFVHLAVRALYLSLRYRPAILQAHFGLGK